MQEQITELEIKLAHLEQALHELSDVMYRQQGQIDRLEAGYEQLRQRVQEGGDAPTGGSPEDEKPPHY